MFGPDHPFPYAELDYLRERGHYDVHPDNRLRLLVYVDGRLVDSWTGSVRDSRWEQVADEFDREPADLRSAYLPVVRGLVVEGFLV
jgi:hypothetical protein